jgi:hypothetical protein
MPAFFGTYTKACQRGSEGRVERARAAAVCSAGSLGEEVGGFEPEEDGARLDRRQSVSLAEPADQGEAQAAARDIVRKYPRHVLALATLLLFKGKLTGRQVARVVAEPAPHRAKLGLAAVACVQDVARRDNWYDEDGGGRRHYRRQVQEHGSWYAALATAARALVGGRRVALALVDAAVSRHPAPHLERS